MLDNPRPIIVYKDFSETFKKLNNKSTKDLKKDIITELKKVSTQPEPKGKIHIDILELQGKAYKFYVGGKKEYRAIWVKWKYKNNEIVLLVVISESKRKDIDYSKDIEPKIWEPVQGILQDLSNRDDTVIVEWQIEGDKIKEIEFNSGKIINVF